MDFKTCSSHPHLAHCFGGPRLSPVNVCPFVVYWSSYRSVSSRCRGADQFNLSSGPSGDQVTRCNPFLGDSAPLRRHILGGF